MVLTLINQSGIGSPELGLDRPLHCRFGGIDRRTVVLTDEQKRKIRESRTPYPCLTQSLNGWVDTLRIASHSYSLAVVTRKIEHLSKLSKRDHVSILCRYSSILKSHQYLFDSLHQYTLIPPGSN